MSTNKSRKEQILESRRGNVPVATVKESPMEVTASTELVLGSIRFEADAENPRFLRFHDAVLARAEVNANRDALDDEGIQELAATIAGTPVDLEHDPKKNVGFYTAGKADAGALKVDGVLWLDRCDALGVNPAEIEDGTYKLSIEAEASTASCSICNTTHNSIASYCQHLKNKFIYKATRFLKGLRAVGGALTKTPAGSATGFSGLYFVASHQLEDGSDDNKKSKSESSVKEFAMEDEKKEPLEEEKKETPEEEKNEAEACNDAKAEDNSVEMKKALDTMTAELEAAKVELKAAQDAKAAVEVKYGELEAQVTAIKASLDEAQNTIKAHRTNELKSKLVGSVMDEAEFTKRQEELLSMPEFALELVARVKRESTERKPEENRLAASETTPDNGRINIIL